jgi:hypothetical protein
MKSANLAICFLGFAGHSGENVFRRSAELGFLASIFDLVSDGLRFESTAMTLFESLVKSTVDKDVAQIIFNLMTRKQERRFTSCGLDRGVDALRIVIKHLQAEDYWASESEIHEAGTLCQIVDDVLDYEKDVARHELNFLGHRDSKMHIQQLMNWDYKRQLHYSCYPSVLFGVIRKAQAKAKKLRLQDLASCAVTPQLQ